MTLEVLVIPTAGDIKDSCELILHTNVLSFRYIVDHWASRGFEALMPDCFYDEVFGEFWNGYLNSLHCLPANWSRLQRLSHQAGLKMQSLMSLMRSGYIMLWRFTFNFFR